MPAAGFFKAEKHIAVCMCLSCWKVLVSVSTSTKQIICQMKMTHSIVGA